MTIEFDKMNVGDKVRVVGAGAPGFAKLGDILTVSRTANDRVWCKRDDGEEAYFALTCGAARLTRFDPIAALRPGEVVKQNVVFVKPPEREPATNASALIAEIEAKETMG